MSIKRYRNTNLYTTHAGATVVTLHTTDIVRAGSHYVTLNSGGWHSYTTKKRMNEAMREFGHRIDIYQRNHEWFVSTPAGEFEYFDGITIDRSNGQPVMGVV